MRTTLTALAATFVVGAAQPVAAQDLARGKQLFEACQSCHSLDPTRTGLPGPHLKGLKGRVLGSSDGFDYSPGFREAKAQALIWDIERLKAYLADPDAVVKGGWMSPPGLDDDADRAAVAALLLQGD